MTTSPLRKGAEIASGRQGKSGHVPPVNHLRSISHVRLGKDAFSPDSPKQVTSAPQQVGGCGLIEG